MPDSPRRAILFDLDGTLVDTITLLLESVRHAFKGRTGRVPTDEEWIAGIGTPLASQLRPYAADEADVAALEQSYRGYQRANLDRLTHAYSGVVDTLRTLHERGHPMAVVTSKSNEMAIRTVDYVGLASYFASIVGQESTTRHKPDPAPVLYALEQMHAPVAGAVFVGDSPYDIRSGNAAGVISVAAVWGFYSRTVLEAAHPAHLLEHISGLPHLLDSLLTQTA
jgi:pyrophosphatase PpaX